MFVDQGCSGYAQNRRQKRSTAVHSSTDAHHRVGHVTEEQCMTNRRSEHRVHVGGENPGGAEDEEQLLHLPFAQQLHRNHYTMVSQKTVH